MPEEAQNSLLTEKSLENPALSQYTQEELSKKIEAQDIVPGAVGQSAEVIVGFALEMAKRAKLDPDELTNLKKAEFFFKGQFIAVDIAWDISTGDNVERAIVKNIIGEIASKAVLIPFALSGNPAVYAAGVFVANVIVENFTEYLVDKAWDYFIGPNYEARVSADDTSVTITSAGTLANTFRTRWDDSDFKLGERNEWAVYSKIDKIDVKYERVANRYIIAEDNPSGQTTSQFADAHQDFLTEIAVRHKENFKAEINEGSIQNVTNYSQLDQNVLSNIGTDQRKFYAVLKLRPFVFEEEPYNSVEPSAYSEQYKKDRAMYLYHLFHKEAPDDQISITFFDMKEPEKATVTPPYASAAMRHYFFGTDNADTSFNPTDYNDHFYGEGGNDVIEGQKGNDYIEGGKGKDTLLGGKGNDIFGINGTDTDYDIFNGGEGTDTIMGGDSDDTIRVHDFSGENTVEAIDGGGGANNVLAGTSQDDTIDLSGTTLSNIKSIETGDQDDVIRIKDFASLGGASIDGGQGTDTLEGTSDANYFNLRAFDVNNVENIETKGGEDVITVANLGDGQIELIDGGDGEDILFATPENDILDLTKTTIKDIERIKLGSGEDVVRLDSDSSMNTDVIIDGGGAGYDYIYTVDGCSCFLKDAQKNVHDAQFFVRFDFPFNLSFP